ncbi:MAG TPA: FAD-dependent oxidoreductase [Chthoniobacterales bacterium]|nr:FAD-dependent oxidoreductase [Chthoniobacterales bacterium]
MGKVLIVGAGINGVTAAISLKKRGHEVTLIDPGPLPHWLAASTDISKAVRSTYGSDEDYTELAEQAVKLWRKWNQEFGTELYHQVGMMFVRREPMQPGDFEHQSFEVANKRGGRLVRLDARAIKERYPAWNGIEYQDGVLEMEAGYAESGRTVAVLVHRAKQMGVKVREGSQFAQLDETGGRVCGALLKDGNVINADTVVMATGAWTPYLLPHTRSFFRATGHAVFHFKPLDPAPFRPECFPVFGADISTTGYYGFPLNTEGVVKIANHGPGREMSPDSPERNVTPQEEARVRAFVASTFPMLTDAPIVYTRICLYCDTHDGHFWIAADPERPGLVIAAGDSGHGFKFAPVLGDIIADVVEEKENRWLKKFRWRPEVRPGEEKEGARYLTEWL